MYAGGSTINANGANASGAGTYGIYATQGSTINASGANASGAGTHGIYASNNSTINAYNAVIQDQSVAGARIVVFNGSTIEASGINTTGGTSPVFSQTINTLTSNGIIYQ